MNTRFVEGNLLFEFGDRWTSLFRWDRHPEFTRGMAKTHGGKAVDFIGIYQARPFFIEVKDFREHARAPDKEPLEYEFELKVRATVAALFGLRWGDSGNCLKAFEALRASHMPSLVLWHEEAQPARRKGPAAESDSRAAAAMLTDKIKKNMNWIEARTIVTSSSDHNYRLAVPDVEVTSLPSGRKKKAEEVVETLEARGKSVPNEVRWQIEDCLDLADLDRLIERAGKVSHASKLLSDRA
jgi:hypothetical protein